MSTDEAMNDLKLGSRSYYRYPKRVSKFIQRPNLISQITSLTTQDGEISPRICILYAMGGQGKTALAVDFCRRAETTHLFLAIFWFDASSEDALKKGLVGISDILKRRIDQTFGSTEERIDFVLQAIEGWNRPWLLIFDNYDNPDRFPNLNNYIPPSSYGSVLITSRNANLARLGTVIEVPPMSEEEALHLLHDRAGGAEKFVNEEEHAKKIVELLGYLPLAIDQAGAYIQRRVNFPLSRFIEEYKDRKESIWSKAPTVWDYKQPVYTTWEMSFELIDEDENDRTEKGQVLTMLSFLDFRNISQDIFKVPRHLAFISAINDLECPQWLQLLLTSNGEWDWAKSEDLFHDFRDLSLVQLTSNGPGTLRLSMHPLVSEWIKYRADLETKRQCLLQAIAIVNMCLRARLQAVERPILSAETEQQVFRHQFSCSQNLRELQEKDSTFLTNMRPFLEFSNSVAREDSLESERILETTKLIEQDIVEASNHVEALFNDKDRQYTQAMLDWLGPSHADILHHELSKAVPGTGVWFFNEPSFAAWVGGHHRELWCCGPCESSFELI